MIVMDSTDVDEDGYYKTSFSVFVAILYLKVLYILVMTLYVLSRFNPTLILAAAALGLFTLLDEKRNQQPVFVPADVVQRVLKPYHFDPICFLYTCYKENLGGAILNQSDRMNFPVQIAAFLNALKLVLRNGSILVLADRATLGFWYYHLTEHSRWDVKLDIDYSEESPSITLLSHSENDKIQMLQNRNFSMVIIDDFDKVAKKATMRKLKGQFKVGLTHRNFVKNPDQRLQWSMLRWTNPNHFGTFDSFCEMDNKYFETFTEPFVDFWQRRTWIFYDLEEETEEEIQEYTETVQKWLSERNVSFQTLGNAAQKKNKAPKRKSAENESSKRKYKMKKKDQPESSEMDLEIVNGDSENEMKRESADEETRETSQTECEEKFCEKIEKTTVEEEFDVIKSSNSDDVLSFLFEDNLKLGIKANRTEIANNCSEDTSESCKLNVNESIPKTSNFCSDEDILTSILFPNNNKNCKLDVSVSKKSGSYSNEDILSELFD